MKHVISVSVLLFALLLALLPPLSVNAATDNFTMSYSFFPGGMGYNGGFTNLILRVTNIGSTNIDRVDAVINLSAGYAYSWTGTIVPGETKEIVTSAIQFSTSDLNETRMLQVGINNDTDANPDGIQMASFTMPGIAVMYDVSGDLPAERTLHPGETMWGGIFIRNMTAAAGMNLADLTLTLTLESSDAEDMVFGTFYEGSLAPGDTAYESFSCELGQEDITEHLQVKCDVSCSVAGITYYSMHNLGDFAVVGLPPDIVFTSVLSADKLDIESGDTVTFRMDLQNIGDDIGSVEVTNLGGVTEANAEMIPSGGNGQIWISKAIYETSDIGFVVIGRSGDTSVSQPTNYVHIAVRQPTEAPTESPETAPLETAAPTDPDAAGEGTSESALSSLLFLFLLFFLRLRLMAGA